MSARKPAPQQPEGILDWTVLKYGWLIVFVIHGIFLSIGLGFLRAASRAHHPTLYSPEQVRISNMLEAHYMFSIAFSLIVVVLAVFVLEIFRATQKLLIEVRELREAVAGAPPSLADLAGESGPLAGPDAAVLSERAPPGDA